MPEHVLPWTLLLSHLRRSDSSRLSYAEVRAAFGEPQLLVRDGILAPGRDDYEPPDCEHRCLPNLDYDTRSAEGLVGVACPEEPACWPGWRWVPLEEVESLRCRGKDVLRALGAANGLGPLDVRLPTPFAPVGLLKRRGLSVPVVWLRSARQGFQQLCRGLRAELGHDALIVVVAKDPRVPFSSADRVAITELGDDPRGQLGLVRALDELTPDYRSRALSEPDLDLDHMHLRFATRPGERHVLEINGQDSGAFRKSDLKFLRLLLLAAVRRNGQDDGWVSKSRLRGGDAKDHEVEDLRIDLAKHDIRGTTADERRALIKASKGDGTIRLAVPPENIHLDPSLAELSFVGPTTTTKRGGQRGKVTEHHEDGLQNAAVLLRDCRRLGAPGEPEEVVTPASRNRQLEQTSPLVRRCRHNGIAVGT